MHLAGPHRWLLNAAITFVSSFFSSILFSFLKVSCSITDSFFSLMTESFTHADLNTSLNVFGWCNLRWVDIYLIRWWIYLALPLHQFLLPTQVFLVLSHIFLVTNFPAAIINDFFHLHVFGWVIFFHQYFTDFAKDSFFCVKRLAKYLRWFIHD